jgi:hypothetical protein
MFIPDPKTVTKERGEKKICYHTFFCSYKFHKIEYYVIFEMLKKKIWANFQRIVEVFTQKIFNMLSNIWVWDPGSEIRKKPIPDPGSRGQKGTGSRIRNTALKKHKTLPKHHPLPSQHGRYNMGCGSGSVCQFDLLDGDTVLM